MVSTVATVRCASCLRAVIQAHELAALVGEDRRVLLKRVRAGQVPEALRSFDRIGYVFDWRDVQRMVCDRWPEGPEREQALRNLLGLRTNALRAMNGVIEPTPHAEWEQSAPRRSPADELLDTELRELVGEARQALGDGLTEATFDAWAAAYADGLQALDVMLRLSVASWQDVVGAADDAAPATEPDLADPIDALVAAGDYFGGPPAYGRFDGWAVAAGCPLRAGGIRRHFGGWNAALRAAGMAT